MQNFSTNQKHVKNFSSLSLKGLRNRCVAELSGINNF
jgi:ribosomal protein S17E